MALFQFLETALLVQFKITTERVFRNSYDFCNSLVQHPVRFETDSVHTSLN